VSCKLMEADEALAEKIGDGRGRKAAVLGESEVIRTRAECAHITSSFVDAVRAKPLSGVRGSAEVEPVARPPARSCPPPTSTRLARFP
jgi:hypothetical protein